VKRGKVSFCYQAFTLTVTQSTLMIVRSSHRRTILAAGVAFSLGRQFSHSTAFGKARPKQNSIPRVLTVVCFRELAGYSF